MEQHRIELTTGITMNCVEAGDPQGEPVLMLHGYSDSRRTFLDTMAQLEQLRPELRLIAPDLRGHGRSSMPSADLYRGAPERAFGLREFTADILALLDAKDIRRAHLVGHSLGSFIAQEIALVTPERAGQLVLIGSTAKVAGNPVIEQFVLGQMIEGTWRAGVEARGLAWPADAYALTPLDLDPNAESWLLAQWVSEPLARPELLAQFAADCARMPLGAWIGVARAVSAMDNRERLQRLTAPTLVLWSTQDGICPERPDQEELLAALELAAQRTGVGYASQRFGEKPLPPSGMAEDDLGHNFVWAVPERIAVAIAAFLDYPLLRQHQTGCVSVSGTQ